MIDNINPIDNMIYITNGSFYMGSLNTEIGRNSLNEDFHLVTLTKDFFIGKYPVTNKLYNNIMGNVLYEYNNCKNDAPITTISWDNIHARNGFLETLNEQEHKLNNIPNDWSYKLPTEAQWEYACRAGSSSSLYNNLELNSITTPSIFEPKSPQINLDKIAWYDYNNTNLFKDGPLEVGKKEPNAWGLYDMLGNVWEWCIDAYEDHLGYTPVIDPICLKLSESRVIRGGCWYYNASFIRCASRGSSYSRSGYYSFGFRLVLSHD